MKDLLTLDVHCSGPKCICPDNKNIHNLEAKKKPIPNVTNFTKYTHSVPDGYTFTLNKTLAGGGGKIGTTVGSPDVPIPKVTGVSVYYWDGVPTNPILLGITTQGSGTPIYYARSSYANDWTPAWVREMNEQQALDNQNCHNNNAIPFNITGSQSGDLLKDSQSNCLKNYRKMTSTKPPDPPPGSNYVTTAYNIPSNTKISRVTYKGKDTTDLTPPTYLVSQIRLYSYPGAINVPLMLEFKSENDGTSTWYYSINANGKNWTGYVGKSSGFYGNNGYTPTSALSEKLDEVLCKWYNNVTLNLTKRHSTSHASNRLPYCCTDHKNEYKVSVEEISVNHYHGRSTKFYKHSITGTNLNLAGIFYNENDNYNDRKNIKLHGAPFPISGIQSVCTFYCQMENPVLIYLCGKSPYGGWYKKGSTDDALWTWIPGIHDIKPETHLQNGLECRQWMKLWIYLKDLGCDPLGECTAGITQLDEGKLRQEIREEAVNAIKERSAAKQSAKLGLYPGGRISGSRSTGAASELISGSATRYLPGISGVTPSPVLMGGFNSHDIIEETTSLLTTTGSVSLPETHCGHASGVSTSEAKGPTPHTDEVTLTQSSLPSLTPGTAALVDGGASVGITAILTGAGMYGGPLAGAGATFFGGWKLYNRYKGDPWVRQI
ncbi:hypothetical protein BEWA_047190 [Theileria equi strain WA]|uniref:Uncharacterized protein n=1 Tax=Theileria equi strain WA TaxID=1537102 RepID=L1LAI7_THEEQ|nr:hypothetical protein BEWA_047190 [Theileria equi strain WA]EKX72254.1 hypothetical protein BEWA_047190 [Theileria equi strain WA]|eukprot:XP_004831706.1 hypothetical protein BEWA_047190 [Theileria equi strain WA]